MVLEDIPGYLESNGFLRRFLEPLRRPSMTLGEFSVEPQIILEEVYLRGFKQSTRRLIDDLPKVADDAKIVLDYILEVFEEVC